MKELYNICEEMCKTLTNELEETNEKVRSMRGKITAGDMDYIDHLTHAIKSVKTTMAMIEPEAEGWYSNYSGRYSGENGRYSSYPTYSPRRGTSMSSRGYSRSNDEMIMELHELMNQAPDEPTRMKFQKFIDELR